MSKAELSGLALSSFLGETLGSGYGPEPGSPNVQKSKSSGYRSPERGSCLETGFSSPGYPATQPPLAMTAVQGLVDRRFRQAVVPHGFLHHRGLDAQGFDE